MDAEFLNLGTYALISRHTLLRTLPASILNDHHGNVVDGAASAGGLNVLNNPAHKLLRFGILQLHEMLFQRDTEKSSCLVLEDSVIPSVYRTILYPGCNVAIPRSYFTS